MDSKNPKPPALEQHILRIVAEQHPRTVAHLIDLVQQQYSSSPPRIMEHIQRLQNQGKLVFKDAPATIPSTLGDYLLSANASWYWIVIMLVVASAVVVLRIPETSYPLVYVRYIVGFLFTLLLPGYSLIKALFPTRDLETIERAALSVGGSLALAAITGLLLTYTPWGIRLPAIPLSLLGVTALFATAGIIREHGIRGQGETLKASVST